MMKNGDKNNHIDVAVIPAAGFGTRMLPAAKAVPKELLPVLDKPVIQYVIEEAVEAGCSDALLVTSREKRAIEDHFDRAPELEDRLQNSGKTQLLAGLIELRQQIRIHSVRQSQQLGLGHAVLQARQHVGDRSFFCMLGDTIFTNNLLANSPLTGVSPSMQLARALESARETFGHSFDERISVIALERVPADRVSKYGIVGVETITPGTMTRDAPLRIRQLVEKPSPDDAPSDLAIAARYLLSPTIFSILDTATPGLAGEIQLTDSLHKLAQIEPVYGVVLESQRHDIGNPLDWLRTNIRFAKADKQLWASIEPLLRELLADQ